MSTRRATISDVARSAGVSPSTASVVFSGKTAGLGCHAPARARRRGRARLHRARSARRVAAPRALGHRRRRVRGAPRHRVPRPGEDPDDGRPDRRRRAARRRAAAAARSGDPLRHRADAHHRAAGCRRARRLQRAAARIARRVVHGTRHPGRGHRGRRRRGHPADRPRQPRGAAPGGEPPARPRPRRASRSSRCPSRAGWERGLDRRRRARSRSTSPASGSPGRATCIPDAAGLRRRRQLHRRGTRRRTRASSPTRPPAHRGHRAERSARGGRDPRGGGGRAARARGRERDRDSTASSSTDSRRTSSRRSCSPRPRRAVRQAGPSPRCSRARRRHPSASRACSARATPPPRAPERSPPRRADGGSAPADRLDTTPRSPEPPPDAAVRPTTPRRPRMLLLLGAFALAAARCSRGSWHASAPARSTSRPLLPIAAFVYTAIQTPGRPGRRHPVRVIRLDPAARHRAVDAAGHPVVAHGAHRHRRRRARDALLPLVLPRQDRGRRSVLGRAARVRRRDVRARSSPTTSSCS